jgi:prevent-host-death family protein
MTTVGVFDAKTHLNSLLERVSKGETIQITRRGVPVAKLVPPDSHAARDPRVLVREIRELRKGITLRGISIKELINEGR